MKYDKLVRDKIPQIIKDKGSIPLTHIADDSEYWVKLKAKLQEEVNEVLEDSNIDEELADVLEVIHAMLAFRGIKFEELEQIMLKKREKRGGFKNKIILEETRSD
ncbi:MAG: phosphoribosyl-ATP pyrophosphohydrolase [Parcubacteria group bacterium]